VLLKSNKTLFDILMAVNPQKGLLIDLEGEEET